MNQQKYFLLGLCAFFLFSCQGATKKGKLEEAVRSYLVSLERRDSNRVIAYVSPERQTTFFKNIDQIDAFHVARAEVQRIYPDKELMKALVTVDLEFFSPTSMEVIAQKRYFSWMYDKKREDWFVEEGHPFGSQKPSLNIQP